MSKYGMIMIIEDDEDDKELFEKVVRELGIKNEIKWFIETNSAFSFLSSTEEDIFLIFCDINLPGKNGIDFKRDVDENPELRKKSIPFLFFSTAASQKNVDEAYTEMVVQGFFKKEFSYDRMKEMLRTIFDYWTLCKHPNAQR
jgi:CheY-like chemotaxis protein